MNLILKMSLLAAMGAAIGMPNEIRAAERASYIKPLEGQIVAYERGDAFITSTREDTTVVFAPRFESKTSAILHFTILNRGTGSVTILEDAVVARIDGRMTDVLGREALAKIEKRKRVFENILTGLAAGANAYAASTQQTTTAHSTHRGRLSDPYGAPIASYSGSSTTTYVDTVATEKRRREAAELNARMISSVQANQAARQAVLDQSVLATQTVRPGEMYSGLVKLKVPRAKRGVPTMLEVAISMDGDAHRFSVALDKPIDEWLVESRNIEREPNDARSARLAQTEPPSNEASVELSPHTGRQESALPSTPMQARAAAPAMSDRSGVAQRTTAFSPTIRGISIRSIESDGTYRTFVFFDVDWTRASITLARNYRGNLVLTDEKNVDRLSMHWPIDRQNAALESFSEREIGFAIEEFGGAGDWLRMTSPSEIRARYELPNPSIATTP